MGHALVGAGALQGARDLGPELSRGPLIDCLGVADVDHPRDQMLACTSMADSHDPPADLGAAFRLLSAKVAGDATARSAAAATEIPKK